MTAALIGNPARFALALLAGGLLIVLAVRLAGPVLFRLMLRHAARRMPPGLPVSMERQAAVPWEHLAREWQRASEMQAHGGRRALARRIAAQNREIARLAAHYARLLPDEERTRRDLHEKAD